MKKILSTILIIIGICIISYPKMSEYYYDYKRKQIMRSLEMGDEREQQIQNVQKDTNKNEAKNVKGDFIKIEKIDLYQPILQGASQQNLNISIGSVNTNIEPGQIGNYALAGHRSHTYGRNFNRLDELKVGDSIEIYHNEKKYVYIVENKIVVKPDEVWVLDSNKVDSEITLITCTPMINPTHRLIIKGKIRKIAINNVFTSNKRFDILKI